MSEKFVYDASLRRQNETARGSYTRQYCEWERNHGTNSHLSDEAYQQEMTGTDTGELRFLFWCGFVALTILLAGEAGLAVVIGWFVFFFIRITGFWGIIAGWIFLLPRRGGGH